MQHRNRWMLVIVLLVAVLQLAACTGKSSQTSSTKTPPAYAEPMEGSEFNRVVLTEGAAQRLDIQTASVVEEEVARVRDVAGEVVAMTVAATTATVADSSAAPAPANSGEVWVRVSLPESDASKVDQSIPARVLPLGADDEEDADGEAAGLMAEWDEGKLEDDLEEGAGTLYYVVADSEHSLVPGQRVMVELTLVDNGKPQKIVPYSAVLYGLNGETWVYVNPEPLVFVRNPITVDFIEDDRVVLVDGPPAGTVVAVVGVAELYGIDTGVGK